eukprot:symbB.v1.2.019252.t1/scaffold1570.1/size113886/4
MPLKSCPSLASHQRQEPGGHWPHCRNFFQMLTPLPSTLHPLCARSVPTISGKEATLFPGAWGSRTLRGVTLAAIAPELSLELLMLPFRQLDSPGGCGGQRRAAWFS